MGLDMYAFSTNVKDELKALYGAVRRSEHYAVHEIKEVQTNQYEGIKQGF